MIHLTQIYPDAKQLVVEYLGTLSIPCSIGSRKFEHVMLDLGFTINIMPAFVYNGFQPHIMHPGNIY